MKNGSIKVKERGGREKKNYFEPDPQRKKHFYSLRNKPKTKWVKAEINGPAGKVV